MSRPIRAAGAPAFETLPGITPPWRLRTHYQPVVRLDTGAPVGLEVLARLGHPEQDWRLPDLFVPALEAAGHAPALTRAVLHSALADWSGGRLEQAGLTLAVNFPLEVMLLPQALDVLEEQRRAASVPAALLLIELTESQAPEDLPALRRAALRFREAGYGVAIDDVVPERDPAPLLDCGFSALKLDRSLVVQAPDGPSLAFIERTVAAAHAAGMEVIAEGIEDVGAWNRARDLGADQAQGYLIARPLAAVAVGEWRAGWSAP